MLGPKNWDNGDLELRGCSYILDVNRSDPEMSSTIIRVF